jgi:hypothetical protein
MFELDHNLEGEHGVELLAYMYGELDQASRTAFETHLTSCDECAFELGSFADARLGVIEWRREDFDPLATPVILIPESEPVAAFADRSTVAGPMKAYWESLLSWPLFARVGTGLAAASLVAGIVYFAVVSRQSAEVADKKPAVIANPSASEPEPKQQIEDVAEHKPASEPNRSTQTEPVKVADDHSAQRFQLASSRTVAKSPIVKTIRPKAETAVTKKAPRLNNVEEEEDKSLRLTDLFAEIGSSEE